MAALRGLRPRGRDRARDPSFEIIAVGEDGSRGPGEPPGAEFAIHADTLGKCTLRAAEDEGESLERGPWRWECPPVDDAQEG